MLRRRAGRAGPRSSASPARARAARRFLVFVDGAQVGDHLRYLAPTLGYPIAMALVEQDLEEGLDVEVDVRGRTMPMSVVTLPFYRRAKS